MAPFVAVNYIINLLEVGFGSIIVGAVIGRAEPILVSTFASFGTYTVMGAGTADIISIAVKAFPVAGIVILVIAFIVEMVNLAPGV
jgi:hypothetical protein